LKIIQDTSYSYETNIFVILSELRKLYDKYGEEGLNPNFQPQQYSKSYSDHPFHFFQEDTGNTFFFNSHPGHGDFQRYFIQLMNARYIKIILVFSFREGLDLRENL
jgi:DnaJ-class molecular chaperone